MNQIDLNGHVAIVTGGAQGIGLAVVERFAASGATVLIWDLDEDLAEETASAVQGNVHARRVDVTDYAEVEEATHLYGIVDSPDVHPDPRPVSRLQKAWGYQGCATVPRRHLQGVVRRPDEAFEAQPVQVVEDRDLAG